MTDWAMSDKAHVTATNPAGLVRTEPREDSVGYKLIRLQEENARLTAQVAALSIPVSLDEWLHAYHVCGSVGYYMDMENVSDLIAARLVATEPK